MPTEQVKITQELIESGKSKAGGWTKAQLAILGVLWPPTNGWRIRACGRIIERAEADRFLALRGVTKKKQKHLSQLLLNVDAEQ